MSCSGEVLHLALDGSSWDTVTPMKGCLARARVQGKSELRALPCPQEYGDQGLGQDPCSEHVRAPCVQRAHWTSDPFAWRIYLVVPQHIPADVTREGRVRRIWLHYQTLEILFDCTRRKLTLRSNSFVWRLRWISYGEDDKSGQPSSTGSAGVLSHCRKLAFRSNSVLRRFPQSLLSRSFPALSA